MRRIDGVQRVSLSSSRAQLQGRGRGLLGAVDPRRRRGLPRRLAQAPAVLDDRLLRRPGDPGERHRRRPGDRRRRATTDPGSGRGRHRPGEHHRPPRARLEEPSDRRDRIVVMVVAAVALLGAFWFLAVAPKRAEVEDRRRQDRDRAAAPRRGPRVRGHRAAGQARLRHRLRDRRPARQGRAARRRRPVAGLPAPERRAELEGRLPLAQAREQRRRHAAAPRPRPQPRRRPPPPTRRSPASSSTPPAAATPAPATQLAAAALPPGATVGAAGFPTMPFTFIFDGSFFDMEHMLRDVNRFITVDGQGRERPRPPAERSTASRSRPRRRASRASPRRSRPPPTCCPPTRA